MKKKSKIVTSNSPSVEILRLETVDGCGIYKSNPKKSSSACINLTTKEESLWCQVTNDFQDKSVHPNPFQEFGIDLDYWPELFCGFSNLEQYKNWLFNPYWRRAFSERGVKMVTYKVACEHVKFGHKQVLFNKSMATKIKDELLSNYF